MKKTRKLDHCLNCGRSLPELENFCPYCGQENKDQKVPVGVFIEELLTSLFSFDGRFLQTLSAFFLKPGKLTLAFNAGQRKKYTHPIRLYLIFSLFYFFMIGFLIPKDMFDRILNSELAFNASGNQGNTDAEMTNLNSEGRDSIVQVLKKEEEIPAEYRRNPIIETPDSILQKHTWKDLRFLSIDPEVSDERFSEALANSPYNFDFGIQLEKKRELIAHSNLFLTQVAKNLPLMMLILLPVFAFFVYLLFADRRVYYIENLILGFHLHAFAYAMYGIVILLSVFGGIQSGWLVSGAFVIVTTYAYVSILRIFTQHWFKTLTKFWVLGGLYLLVLSAGMGLELYISLILL